MISIKDGELANLWTDETSPEFKSILYALHMGIVRILEKAAGIGSSADIDHLNEDVLDYMAVELRAMYYDQYAPLDEKRAIIKNTLKWYTKAGTVKATEELIASVFGGDARLIEWFDFQEPPAEPNTFDVETEAVMTKDIINELSVVIKKVKNAKSHLRRVTVFRELHSGSVIVPHITSRNECIVSNHEISSTDIADGISSVAIVAPVSDAYVLNIATLDVETSPGVFIANVTSAEGSTYVLNDKEEDTEAAGIVSSVSLDAHAEGSYAVNTTDAKTNLSQGNTAAMRAHIDYQTTTVEKGE